MSIPPLVCSTPPPPDQCEDDKDTEDYDLQYNLSQEDEDDNYDFGNFSSFNQLQSSQNQTDPVITTAEENLKKHDSSKHEDSTKNMLGTNIISESKAKIIEENNVEDLDLKLEHETLENDDSSKKSHIELKSQKNIDSIYETAKSDYKSPVKSGSVLQSDEFVEPPSLDKPEEPPSYVDEIIAAVGNCSMTPTVSELHLDFSEDVKPNEELSLPESKEEKQTLKMIESEDIKSETEISKMDSDDFGDFYDFQFAAPIEKPATLDICDNPWQNCNTPDDDFGDFKASFDEGEINVFSANNLVTEHSTEISRPEECVKNVEQFSAEAEVDDDFGDFDDFKSSSAEGKTSINADESEETIPQFPLLNLEGTDEQILEYINNVINTEYEDEIEEPSEEIIDNLESVLGVTWGHLLAVDERQPYMVTWNNSLGQKTLLKALCIDSRNILFGPKWNYSMPKYAATLTAAPLQPQKQVTSPTQAEPSSQDKATGKSGTTWSDPFTSDGQESCKPEPPSQNLVIETGPTDLDVFEASTSSKPDKIFSSTLSVQPMRQISLPDTHIFTPTDSETPRSTTIHYDNSPTVLLPQTIKESKSEPSFKAEQTLSPQPSTSTADDDYWEFQDFKGPLATNPIPLASIVSRQPEILKTNSNVTYATQVLQPIKVEPIIPTLNWPDPGEVKETFHDFSDFVSSTTLSNQPTPIVPVPQTDSKPRPDLPGPGIDAPKTSERISGDASGDFDDDFDTFQSALPAANSSNAGVPNISGVSNAATGGTKLDTQPQAAPSPVADFEFAFPKVNNVKSETISFENMTKPKDAFQTQTKFFPNHLESKGPPLQTPSAPMATGLLQPMPVNSTATLQNQQKCGQILQPLSLESFSQINWPNPGIDLQDLSRFNPVETLHSLKSDLSANSQSKVASPVHGQKSAASAQLGDDEWGEFVSSKPKPQPQQAPKRPTAQAQLFSADDDEWTDFVSSTSVKPQNGLNTISFNVHSNTNLTIQKPKPGKFTKKSQLPLDIPSLNYITPKSTNHKAFNDRHLNL